MRILIVDNDKNTVETLRASLADESDIKIDVAYGGREAVDILTAGADYDLVVLDIMMPEVSGIDVCQAMAEDKRLSLMPVLLISALPISSSDFRSSVEKMGELSVVKDVLEKPFSKEDLVNKIRVSAGCRPKKGL
jgi:CheY-like chemotaxis protein